MSSNNDNQNETAQIMINPNLSNVESETEDASENCISMHPGHDKYNINLKDYE